MQIVCNRSTLLITLSSIRTKKCNEPIKLLNDLLHPRHSSQSRVNRSYVHNFEFSLKTDGLAARLLLSCAYDLPQGGGFGSQDILQEIHKLSTKKNVKYGRKANLSTLSRSDISEVEDNYRNCSECKKKKKNARNEKFARNTRSW